MMDNRSSRELLAGWLAGDLDTEGTARLLELCREQPEILDEAARLKSYDRLLHVAMLDAGEEAFVHEVAARCGLMPEASDGSLIANVHWRVSWRKWLCLAAAACAVLGLGIGLWWQRLPVAVVARLEAAQWRNGDRLMQAGDQLSAGRFELASGFAALTFNNGAELLVEGPAKFELISSKRVRLQSGRAFATVPEPAIGFTVEGPTGRVIDRGTEFGVHVSEDGMEVHVLKGWVEAGHGSALRAVRENEALRMSAKAVNTIPADRGRFLTGLPPKADQPIGWVRWGFDENEGETTRHVGTGIDAGENAAHLLSLDGSTRGPQWTTGQFGSALSFDGEDDYVQTDFVGIAGSAARSVAFWVKVPRDFQPRNGYAMVCWGSSQDLTEGWQISINPKKEQGQLGTLRVARIGGPIIGTTDLRDDRWHHVAVVFFGGDANGEATQVLIYLDGELEHTVRKGMLNVRTDTVGPNTRRVAFGLNIGPANPNPAKAPTWRVFRGCLDEIYICNAALTQGQVRELMLRNHATGFASLPGR